VRAACCARCEESSAASGGADNPRHPRWFFTATAALVDTWRMNDFHIALLWLRSLEIVIGHSPVIMLSELELHDLFVRYRSPYKA
jgi:hypothetical protein